MPAMPMLSVLIGKKKPGELKEMNKEADGRDEMPTESHDGHDVHHAIMESFMKAVKEGDVEEACSAFKDLFDLLDSEPHEEGPHKEDDEGSY